MFLEWTQTAIKNRSRLKSARESSTWIKDQSWREHAVRSGINKDTGIWTWASETFRRSLNLMRLIWLWSFIAPLTNQIAKSRGISRRSVVMAKAGRKLHFHGLGYGFVFTSSFKLQFDRNICACYLKNEEEQGNIIVLRVNLEINNASLGFSCSNLFSGWIHGNPLWSER